MIMKDNIAAFGSVAGITSIVSGGFLFLFLRILNMPSNIEYLGIIWIIFGFIFFLGTYFFEKGEKRKSGTIFITFGFIGLPLGVGFFVGSFLAIGAGSLAFKYSIYGRKLKD